MSLHAACGCLTSNNVTELVPFAERAAARVTGRRVTLRPATLHNTVLPEPDPLLEGQQERALAVLCAVAHCDRHRSATAKASPAIRRRVHAAVIAYLTSDTAHRPTAARDLVKQLEWAIGDHARHLTAGTPATSRPDRTGAQFRRRHDHARLLTDVQVQIFVYLARGLQRPRGHASAHSGDPLAAHIMLRSSTCHDALTYLHSIDTRTHRGPLTRPEGVFARLTDDALLAELRGFTDVATWSGGTPDAQRVWVWMTTRAREILSSSIDSHWNETTTPSTETVATHSVFADEPAMGL